MRTASASQDTHCAYCICKSAHTLCVLHLQVSTHTVRTASASQHTHCAYCICKSAHALCVLHLQVSTHTARTASASQHTHCAYFSTQVLTSLLLGCCCYCRPCFRFTHLSSLYCLLSPPLSFFPNANIITLLSHRSNMRFMNTKCLHRFNPADVSFWYICGEL